MGNYRELSRFVLSRGLILSAILLLGAALCLLGMRTGSGGMAALRLYEYAGAFQSDALVAFGCGTLGSLLMEDMLRYYGE